MINHWYYAMYQYVTPTFFSKTKLCRRKILSPHRKVLFQVQKNLFKKQQSHVISKYTSEQIFIGLMYCSSALTAVYFVLYLPQGGGCHIITKGRGHILSCNGLSL